MRIHHHLCFTVLGSSWALAPVLADLPAHPEQITFAPFNFIPPKAADFRHTLPSGVAVYLAPSHEFPLIDLSLTFRGGAYLDSADKIGVAGATGAMMRRGGTKAMPPAQLDEEFDFLAANAGTGVGGTESSATLNCLASNFDQAFALFMDMVRNPGFDAERFAIYKDEVIESMKQRNDNASAISGREWSRLLYGEDHFQGRDATGAMIQTMTVDDLRAMHERLFHPAPGHLFIAVSGDFDPSTMLAKLEAALNDWPAGAPVSDPPAPTHALTPGLYHIEKDIPQGKVVIGMRGIQRDDPDFFPALLMNDILGGGGFTSRIMSRVRSDEGLAYSAGSQMQAGVYYPGEFRAGFESKNPTVALATKIVYEEIERIRTEPVTEESLEMSKASFIERFPRTFESKPSMLRVFVSDELTRRDPNYWQTYRDNVKSVTPGDVQRVARERLTSGSLAIFIVGKWAEIYPGDLDGRAKMSDFFGGNVNHIPLRDPLTLEPMEN